MKTTNDFHAVCEVQRASRYLLIGLLIRTAFFSFASPMSHAVTDKLRIFNVDTTTDYSIRKESHDSTTV